MTSIDSIKEEPGNKNNGQYVLALVLYIKCTVFLFIVDCFIFSRKNVEDRNRTETGKTNKQTSKRTDTVFVNESDLGETRKMKPQAAVMNASYQFKLHVTDKLLQWKKKK